MIAAVLWTLLAALFAALVTVAVTPVRLRCVVSGEPRFRAVVVARLLWGLAPPIRLFDSARREAKRSRKPAPRKRRPRFRDASHIVREASGLLAELLRRVRFHRLSVDADFGLDDPADTGQLLGLFQVARYTWPAAPGVSVQVRPDFEHERVAGRLDAEVSFIPVTFVSPAIRFGWRAFGPGR